MDLHGARLHGRPRPAVPPRPGPSQVMPDDAALFPIGLLAERFGLRPSAIHFYERAGMLAPARRSPSGHRLYGAQDIRCLELIVAARELGCSLADIREVVAMTDDRQEAASRSAIQAYRALLRRKRQALRRVERALAARGGPGRGA